MPSGSLARGTGAIVRSQDPWLVPIAEDALDGPVPGGAQVRAAAPLPSNEGLVRLEVKAAGATRALLPPTLPPIQGAADLRSSAADLTRVYQLAGMRDAAVTEPAILAHSATGEQQPVGVPPTAMQQQVIQQPVMQQPVAVPPTAIPQPGAQQVMPQPGAQQVMPQQVMPQQVMQP